MAPPVRDYITNLPMIIEATRSADLVRDHGGIENSLHAVLDDTFREDRSHLRTSHPACHRVALRCVALNFLTIL